MSKSQSKIPSPSRSQGAITPRRPRSRRTLSAASPARSEVSCRLSSVVEKVVKEDFVLSPWKRRSVLPDDTEIEAPRRASWWKRLDGSSREVLEALDTNKMTDGMLVEEYEFEIEKDKNNQSVPESSDNESVASIVVPQRRLFNQKKQPQGKFADIMGSRKSLGKTNDEDQSIEDAPKSLFNKGPRNKPVFPAALLNSTNKTINKTVEPEPTKQARPNLFGQAGTKRKNMFTDFVLSDSEEDSEVQHKIFGFQKNNNKRISLGTRNRRMPSLTPSMTTEIDIDDWNLLPSSTMIGAQEDSRMSTDNVEQVEEENRDDTLTEENECLNRDTNDQPTRKKSIIENDDNDKTLTNENIEDASKIQDIKNNKSEKNNKTLERSKTKLNVSVKDKSSTRVNAENVKIIEEIVVENQQKNVGTKNQITVINEKSLEDKVAELHGEYVGTKNQITVINDKSFEDKIAELHGECVDKEESQRNILLNRTKENPSETKTLKQYSKGEQEINPSAEGQEVQPSVSKAASNVSQNKEDDFPENDKTGKELKQSNAAQKSDNSFKEASNINQDEDMLDVSKKDKSGESLEPVEELQSLEHSKEEGDPNQDMENGSEEDIGPSAEEEATHDHSGEGSQTNQVDVDDKSEEGFEPSVHDENNQEESNEESHENEENQEESNEESQQNEEKQEESNEESQQNEENQEESNEVSHEMGVVSEKDEDEGKSAHDQASHNDSKEESYENQDEGMEKMVWNDNDDEEASNTSETEMDAEAEQNHEVVSREKGNKINENDGTLGRNEIANKSRNLTNMSHKIVESSVNDDQIEEDVVDETPNNSTHDTTGRNRKKESIVKSPEAVLQNMTNDNESFRPIGRSTTFRKSKSVYETMNRPSLAPVQESTLGSDGSRNSSTEGSEWDSHRTTRKTIRQTLGKEYTTRKSLRALVMEQSAKRQTELYNKNTSHLNKTKSKTVLEGNDKNASKMNKTVLEDANKTATVDKTKNRTVSEDDKNSSKINKTRNKTVLEDVNNKNASAMNKTKNKTVIEDIDDQHIRFRRTSNSNLNNQSPNLRSPVLVTSTHHVPDPLISEHQLSYHKSLHDIKDPEVSAQISNREDSINIPLPENDSGPEISMNASYGQGMSADTHHETSAERYETDVQMKENSSARSNEVSGRNTRAKPVHNYDQEILDYEASELEKSEQELSETEVDQENLEREDYVQNSMLDEEKENSKSENEMDVDQTEQDNEEDSREEMEASEHDTEAESEQESQQEIESEQEEQQEIESEHEHEQSQQEMESEQEESQREIESEQEEQQEIESEQEESQQEIESEQEESQQEIESEHEESQREIESEQEEQQEIESEQEESQQEIESEQEEQQQIESEQEESQQEIESEHEESQQEIESEQEESHQEVESEHESENEQDRDISQPESDQESDLELSRGHESDSEDNDDFVSRHSQYQTENTRGVSRVVFDSEMMSVEEIDFEGVSRRTDNNVSEQSERGAGLSRNTLARVSEPSVHEVSVGTRKSMLLMQMQKIAQQNMEIRQKIRDKVQKSLKPPRNCSMSPVPKYSVRRITKEPRQPKKPKPAGIPMEMLPKDFVDDLKYKPPKRFQPPNAPWITKRLYKFLEAKLEPKYEYRARVRAEELVQTIHSFSKLVRRRREAPAPAVAALAREMARLRVVNTHHDFYQFFHQFMPREVRIKVNPDVVNKIPMPRDVFGEILQSRTAVE